MKEKRNQDKALKSSSESLKGKGESDGFVAVYVLLEKRNIKNK